MILSLKYLATLLAAFQVKAQTLTGDTLKLRGSSLPAVCQVGQLKFNSSNYQFYGCTASNTWGTIGGSGADLGLTNLTATSITVSLIPSGGTLNLGQAGSNYWNQVIANNLRDNDGGLSYDIALRQISNGNVTVFDSSSNAQIKVLGDGTAAASMLLNKSSNTAGVTLAANDGMTASFTLTLPTNVGTAGQVLTTNNGTLSFTDIPSPSTIATVYTNKIVDLGGNSTIDFTFGPIVIDSNQDVNINANGTGIVNYGANRFRLFSVSGTTAPMVEFREVGGGNYVGLRSQNSIASDIVLQLPSSVGSSGQALKTDGTGIMSWGDVITAPVTVANGGTNNATLSTTAGGVLYMDGSKVMNTGAGNVGYMIRSGGSGAPTFGNRVCRLRFTGPSDGTNCTNGATCAIWNVNDTCATGITAGSAGAYTVAFAAGFFTGAPVCMCNSHATGIAYSFCSITGVSTASLIFGSVGTGGNLTHSFGAVMCIGD